MRFSDNTIRENVVTYEGCTGPMKDISKIDLILSSYWLKYEIFWNEELWESKHIVYSMLHACFVLDYYYKKTRKVT